MACQLCESTPKSWEGEEPRCAFPDNKNFTSDNWNCLTMNALRSIAYKSEKAAKEESFGDFYYRNDESGTIGIVHIASENENIAGYLVLTWYKERGRMGSAMIVCTNEEPRKLHFNDAIMILDGRKEQSEETGKIELAKGAGSRDPVIMVITSLRARGVSEQEIANGLAHLNNRQKEIRSEMGTRLVEIVMSDQFNKEQTPPLTERSLLHKTEQASYSIPTENREWSPLETEEDFNLIEDNYDALYEEYEAKHQNNKNKETSEEEIEAALEEWHAKQKNNADAANDALDAWRLEQEASKMPHVVEPYIEETVTQNSATEEQLLELLLEEFEIKKKREALQQALQTFPAIQQTQKSSQVKTLQEQIEEAIAERNAYDTSEKLEKQKKEEKAYDEIMWNKITRARA